MHTNLDLTNTDHVPSSVTHSGSNAMLYIFEDNEAVIEMIITGQSPTIRHVSRTHRVPLEWFFDKNHIWNSVEQLFNETGRLIRDPTEITGDHD